MAVCGKPGMKSNCLLFALSFVVLFGCAYCQAQIGGVPEANIEGMTIGSIEIESNRTDPTVSRSEVLNAARVRPGQSFSKVAVAEGVERISDLEGVGLADYRAVAVGNQVKLTFIVDERNLVRSIVFQGSEAFGEKKLLKELDFKRGDYLDELNVNGGAEAIKRLYLEKGYSSVRVEKDEQELSSGRVVYKIEEGPRPTIKEVNVEGNTAFTAKELLKAMKTKPKKFLFWPVRYNAEDVAADADRLVDIYQERGYLDVKVIAEAESGADGRWGYVTFKIDEGPVYIVDEIIMSGNQHFSADELRSELKLQVGDYYSQDRADYDVKHIRGRFLESGFVDATAAVGRTFSASAKVKVEFTISQGERFRIGLIDITGNEMAHDRVMRRILDEEGFRPGEWFNADLARGDGTGDLEVLLKRMVYTTSATIEPMGASPGRRDARVTIEEGQTGSIMLGAGVTSNQGLIGEVRYDERNFDIMNWPKSWSDVVAGKAFRGAGQRLRASVNPGTIVSRFSVSFTQPYVYDRPVSLETAISGYERFQESYDEKRLKGYLGFEKRYPNEWRRGFSFRAESVEVLDLEFDAPQEIRDVKGNNDLAGVRVYIRRDTTDNRFLPTKGYNFSAGYEQVGGDFTFGVVDGTHRWYKTLYEDLAERKTVFELKLHAATVIGDAPPFEKFYGGGTGSIRGFEYRGVSTRGLQTNVANPQRKDPIGSDWIFTSNAEVAVPLASEVFSALFFVDTGMIESGGVRASVGTGLQIMLPQWFGPVPMRFELAVPFMDEEEDETKVFSFSVGALF